MPTVEAKDLKVPMVIIPQAEAVAELAVSGVLEAAPLVAMVATRRMVQCKEIP